jgi:hypothetical protein
VEALHDVVYFAPGAAPAYAEIGCKGWWMGYFASRAAALGPVGPETVAALFFGFAPAMVHRAIPDAWNLTRIDQVLETRARVAEEALTQLIPVADGAAGAGTDTALAELLSVTEAMVAAAPRAGRGLFAATAARPRPSAPLAALWHDATALREFRGDSHVAVLVDAGLTGCTANRLMAALGLVPPNQRDRRGWTEPEWEQAADELAARGWLAGDGTATEAGRTARERIEARTDALSAPLVDAVGDEAFAAALPVAVGLASTVASAGLIPYPNPTGVPAGVATDDGSTGRIASAS